jgi:ABC-2 type transport system permease protein
LIATIARKEMTEMWRDGRFRVASVVTLTLLIIALGLGWKGARRAGRERAAADSADRAEWLAQGERNPHSAAHFGRYAFKPTTTLAFLDRGIHTYLGVAVWMEAHYQDPFRYRPAEDATSLQRFGELTAAIVLQILLPLLIILLAFAQFAGEREQGTLRQLLSLGAHPRDLAMGKAVGVMLALSLTLAPAVFIGVAALAAASGEASPLRSADRFLLLALVYLLYFGAILGVALAVSASVRSARVALLALLAFWIASCLIAPRAAADVAQRIEPAPSYTEFWGAINRDLREGMNGHDSADKRREELKRRVLAQYNVSSVEDLPVNFDGIALQDGEEYGNQVFGKHYGNLWDTFERQNRLQDLSATVTPIAAVRSLSMGLAGTDFAQHRDFARAAEEYRRAMVKRMNDEFRDRAGRAGFDYFAGADLWKSVADFTYEPLSTPRVLAAHKLSIALLVAWFALAGFAAVAAAARVKFD